MARRLSICLMTLRRLIQEHLESVASRRARSITNIPVTRQTEAE